jgi:hypothetical protein
MDGPAVNDAGNDSSKNDAANDGAVDAGWTPKNLAELVLWTESSAVDVSDAGTCPTWPDQSPVGNTLHAKTIGPDYTSSSPIDNGPALEFGNAMASMSAALTSFGTTPFIVAMVINPGVCSGACTLWALGGSGNVGSACNLDFELTSSNAIATFYCTVNDTGQLPITEQATHLVGFRRSSLIAAEVRVDGNAKAFTLTQSESTATIPSFSIGGGANGAQADIAEVIVATNPSDNDVAQIESYLKARYGL